MKQVLYFSTPTCAPCRMFYPTVEEVCNQTGTSLTKIDASQDTDLVTQYQVTSVPTVVIIQNGSIVLKNVGIMPKPKLLSFLK